LIHIYYHYLKENKQKMVEKGVRFDVVGDISPFPDYLQEEIRRVIEMTKNGNEIELIVALNYGGRDDIKRAVKKIVGECLKNKWDEEQISEELISRHLDTAKWQDPDLLIRTSNERRLSNFLLWQLAYSEMYFTETLWPDFTPHELMKAVLHYQERERRRGG
jgi:undecaprenyl diphosphate synthase